MMRKSSSSIVKVCVLALLVLSLCFVCSCKKSEEPAAGPTDETPSKQPDVNSPDVKVDTPAVDANAAAKAPDDTTTSKTPDEPTEPNQAAVAEKAPDVPEGWGPIVIDLPKPMFVGTPQDTKVENLEKPRGTARPPFMAPAGTKNVAFEKPVSSSDEEPIIGEIEMITDGDKEAADGSYVELGPFKQEVTIDLDGMYNIYAIVAWHYHKQARVYFDVAVQVADDADFISNVKTLFNNDIDNSIGLGVGKDMHYTETNEGKLIDAKGVKARYVRLYSQGNTSNDLNHYIEVEVYGIPAE